DVPILTIVSVNVAMCFFSIPNCPAISATPAISSYVAGIVLFICLNVKSSSLNSLSVPSTVFFQYCYPKGFLSSSSLCFHKARHIFSSTLDVEHSFQYYFYSTGMLYIG